MTDRDDIQLGSVLRAYLHGELDGQLGRAEARFLCEQTPVPVPISTRRGAGAGRWPRLWWAPLAGSIAAAVAIVWGAAALHPSTGHSGMAVNTHSVAPTTQPATAPEETYSETIDVRTVDEGTVVTDDQGPARQFRREVIEHVEWFDPAANQRIQLDIPSEEIVLVGMNAY